MRQRYIGRIRGMFLFLLAFMVAGCSGDASRAPRQMHVAAAANLSYVMDELLEGFREAHPDYADTDMKVTLASSGSLTSQIRNNAPYDIFLAANVGYPEALVADGLAAGEPVVYAAGVPVLVYRGRAGIEEPEGVGFLGDAVYGKIALAQPELAPYGQAAVDIMKKAGMYEELAPKFVFGKSITQTFQLTVTAADAGFIAKSLLYGDKGGEIEKAGLKVREFSASDYRPDMLRQAMVLLDDKNELAREFFLFMQGDEAREILQTTGYKVQ